MKSLSVDFSAKCCLAVKIVSRKTNILSGGEKVRCMTSRLMLKEANLLMLDEPTNHLDLESIQAMNNALVDYKGTLLFASHDHHIVQTVANKIIEFTPNGSLEKMMTFDEYLASGKVQKQRESMMAVTA